ncbi:MAG: methyltransferase [Gordonia sp. (in: high G+C Gram-positive bacteria)]|uniref:methyltransferase n=1 Tax=Gordonia sp. (in: high G+C Gram-positive bacteria) TaxID=84139 RepID=UPI0039E3AA6C
MTDDSLETAIRLSDPLTPMAIRVAASLGVFEAVAAGNRDAASVAAATGTDTAVVGDLLTHLAGVGALDHDDAGFAVNDVTAHFLDDGLLKVHLGLDTASGLIAHGWWGLADTVRSGGPGFDVVAGRSFWDEVNATREMSASFDDYIAHGVQFWAPDLIAYAAASPARSWADVGGGNGTLLAQLLEADPQRTGVVVELPRSAEAATAFLDANGVGDRGVGLAGDFLTEVPAGYDAYLLAQVLHDWPDDDAVTILHNCAAAAGTGGHVLVVERLAESGQAGMSLMMANLFGATERRVDDYLALADRAGLALTAQAPAADGEMGILDFVVAH